MFKTEYKEITHLADEFSGKRTLLIADTLHILQNTLICNNGLPWDYNIVSYVLHNPAGVNLPTLLSFYSKIMGVSLTDSKEKHKHYINLQRKMKVLEDKGYIISKKQGGLIWYDAEPQALMFYQAFKQNNLRNHPKSAETVDLIEAYSKTQTRRCQNHKPEKKAVLDADEIFRRKFIKKRHYAWRNAQFLKKYHHLTRTGWRIVNEHFTDYKEDVADRKLIFGKDNLSRWVGKRGIKQFDKYMAMPYVHRFKEDKVMDKIKEYNVLWGKIQSRCGVHWSVTFDGGTIGETSDNSCKFFNHLMSYVVKHRIAEYRRRFGKDVLIPDWLKHRPKYVKIAEFQDNGRLHLHIIIFGLRRIGDKFKDLTPELERIGFGKINYIYPIKQVRNGKWVWANQKPEDAKTNNVQSHLKKYLEKALVEHEKIAMYWLTDKRFFTYSYSLGVGGVDGVVVPEGWAYVGVWSVWDMPDFVMDNLVNPDLDFKGGGYG